jgi:hypothetical protein
MKNLIIDKACFTFFRYVILDLLVYYIRKEGSHVREILIQDTAPTIDDLITLMVDRGQSEIEINAVNSTFTIRLKIKIVEVEEC